VIHHLRIKFKMYNISPLYIYIQIYQNDLILMFNAYYWVFYSLCYFKVELMWNQEMTRLKTYLKSFKISSNKGPKKVQKIGNMPKMPFFLFLFFKKRRDHMSNSDPGPNLLDKSLTFGRGIP
jgi:hypothetical protein